MDNDDRDKTKGQIIQECRSLREQVDRCREDRRRLREECENLRGHLEQARGAEEGREQLISDLRLSEQRLGALAQSTSDWVWELNEDLEYVYVSPRVKDLLGYDPEKVLGRRPFDFMPARHAKLAAEAFRAFLEQGRLFTGYETEKRHKNGNRVYVESMGVPVYEGGRIVGIRGVDRNITPRKEAQKRLRRAHKELARRVEERTAELRAANTQLEEEIHERRRAEAELRDLTRRLNTLVEAIPDVLYFKDTEGRNLVFNEAAAEFFGARSQNVVGKKDEEFMPPELAQKCRRSDEMALDQEGPVRVEERMEAADGRTLWFDTIKNRITDREGQVQGLVGVSRDVTERREMEEELRESRRRLSTLMDNLPGMAYRCRNTERWTMEFISRGAKELTGYARLSTK